MKLKLFIFSSLLSFSNIQGMLYSSWISSSQTNSFDSREAEEKKTHDDLLKYLYSMCDDYQPNKKYEFFWRQTKLLKGDSFAFEYIEKRAKEGCIVSCYMMARNLIEKCSDVLQSDKYCEQIVYINENDTYDYTANKFLKECMFYVSLCLLIVVAQTVMYYRLNKNSDILTAYTVLKNKFKYLLTSYLTKILLDAHNFYPNFSYLIGEVNEYFGKIEEKCFFYNCSWIPLCNWINPNTPYSYGITFGNCEILKKIKNNKLDIYKKKTVNEIAQIASRTFMLPSLNQGRRVLVSRFRSWKEFFESDNFYMKEIVTMEF